jgi:hypothetical protein
MTAKSRRRKLEKKNKILLSTENPRHTFTKRDGTSVEVVAPTRTLAEEHFTLQYGYSPAAE